MKINRIAVGSVLAVVAAGCGVAPEGDGPVQSSSSAITVGTVAASSTITVGTVESAASDAQIAANASTLSYAAIVYGEFQNASDGAITFRMTTLATGAATNIAGQTVQTTLGGVPDYWIDHEALGNQIDQLTVGPRDPTQDEWTQDVNLSPNFDNQGYPVSAATYRLLSVNGTIQGTSLTWESLELCWSSQNYCIIMDPVVLWLDSYAGVRMALQATGWAMETATTDTDVSLAEPTASTGATSDGTEVATTVSYCSLDSNPKWGSHWLTWSPYPFWIKDIYGIKLISGTMGGQQAGIACYISGNACKSSGFGYGSDSSCNGNLGWNCDCNWTDVQTGTTASTDTTRTWAQSKCVDKFIGSVTVKWTRKGVDSGFSIVWDTNGGTFTNGGTILDACHWHT